MNIVRFDFGAAASVSIGTIENGVLHRRAYVPGDDISGLPDDVRAKIEAYWTPERVAERDAILAANSD